MIIIKLSTTYNIINNIDYFVVIFFEIRIVNLIRQIKNHLNNKPYNYFAITK